MSRWARLMLTEAFWLADPGAPACPQRVPVSTRAPRAAAIERGTATAPRRLALAIEGRAPAVRAARNHRNQAREPVTNRFGPRLSPTSIAKGWAGTRAAKSDAAGRLLSSTDETAATTAVPHRSRCDINVAGPDHTRPRVPSATATPNSPTSTGTPNTSTTRRGCSARAARRTPTTATPTAATGMAGLCRTTTSTAAASDRDQTESQRRPAGRGWILDANPQGSVLDHGDHGCGHDQGGQRGGPGVGEELAPVEVEVTNHDQVGQVGAGQEQRPGVGEKKTPVEQRRLALAPAAGGVDQDRGEEGHRSVEVQHRSHRSHHGDRPHEEDHTVRRGAGQTVAGDREQAVGVGHQTR